MNIAKLKPILPGEFTGEIVKVERLSFYGEVDAKQGKLYDGRSIKGKVLVIMSSRGSTVGSYIIYGLKYYGNQPLGIVMVKSEPIVIVGSIISGIPLFEGLPVDVFNKLRDGCIMSVDKAGNLRILEC
ncbi:MAG: DUF126 domain-containing protein [Desulfurococcales archaeon]|nr:DUF126 domain-containing protein [Desulfurococcales archaeon]